MNDIKRLGGNARMSDCVVHNGVVHVRGLTARGGPDDIEGQTSAVLAHLDTILAGVGVSRERLLQIMIWLRDINDFDAMNGVYDTWVVPGAQPVRACVQAHLASPALRIEIAATAAL